MKHLWFAAHYVEDTPWCEKMSVVLELLILDFKETISIKDDAVAIQINISQEISSYEEGRKATHMYYQLLGL